MNSELAEKVEALKAVANHHGQPQETRIKGIWLIEECLAKKREVDDLFQKQCEVIRNYFRDGAISQREFLDQSINIVASYDTKLCCLFQCVVDVLQLLECESHAKNTFRKP